ncbi:MAG TPA: D-alanyl-D-alanine carboxypeptidase [Mycobacteriales bacterium]|nr:D-alanyl-D-alanine carboxypeptidase [Mycobacteriales bacterium]
MPHRLRPLAVTSLVALAGLLAMPTPASSALPRASHTDRPATSVAGRHSRALSSLAAAVRRSIGGSTARHVDYRIVISGLGTISHDASHPTPPASNEKLFTVITLMDLVGPEFRYATKIYGTAPIVDHTVSGDLVVVGSGDPTLTIANLRELAKRLHAKGLRHVTGHLIVDDTRYSHTTRVAGWKRKFVPGQSRTVDAFTVDENQWRAGASFERDPTPYNAALFRKALRKSHITVAHVTRVEGAPGGLHTLAIHHSPDLAAITDATLTDSINFNAEMMLREAGAQLSGHGTPATGVAAVRAVATALGLPFGIDHDGSGLSYADRESPATIVAWLTKLTTLSFYSRVYFALPLSCETGTLEGRMCGRHVRGRVRAKTGTLDHNTALSGYTTTLSGHRVTFSFLLSGFKDRRFTRVMGHVNAAVETTVRKG